MIDLWSRLELIFAIPEQIFPEIEIINLSEDSTREVADYVVHHLRGVTTHFRTFMSEDIIPVNSPQNLIDGVTTGYLIGAVGGELYIEHFVLPEMLFVFEEPGYMILSYGTGLHWTPISLIGLFEFFRIVKKKEPECEIRLSPHFFAQDWMNVFNRLLRKYLNDTIS